MMNLPAGSARLDSSSSSRAHGATAVGPRHRRRRERQQPRQPPLLLLHAATAAAASQAPASTAPPAAFRQIPWDEWDLSGRPLGIFWDADNVPAAAAPALRDALAAGCGADARCLELFANAETRARLDARALEAAGAAVVAAAAGRDRADILLASRATLFALEHCSPPPPAGPLSQQQQRPQQDANEEELDVGSGAAPSERAPEPAPAPVVVIASGDGRFAATLRYLAFKGALTVVVAAAPGAGRRTGSPGAGGSGGSGSGSDDDGSSSDAGGSGSGGGGGRGGRAPAWGKLAREAAAAIGWVPGSGGGGGSGGVVDAFGAGPWVRQPEGDG